MGKTRDPIIVAFDVPERERLLELAESLRGGVETVKVGLEAYASLGPEAFDLMRREGFRVFADLKLHDIPNTVAGAVRGLVAREVEMITVHIGGGRKMLREAARAAREAAAEKGFAPPALLGVTVLTSLDDASLRELGFRQGAAEAVLSLAELGMECGLDGVVASAREAAALRERLGPQALIVTPGIRPEGEGAHDQARVATPAQALRAGADYLVVGRPITASPRPREALEAVRRQAVI